MAEPMLEVPRRVLDAVLKDMACMADHALDDCPAKEIRDLLAKRTVVVQIESEGSKRWVILKENDAEVARRELLSGIEIDMVSERGESRWKFVPAGCSRRMRDWTKGVTMTELVEWITNG